MEELQKRLTKSKEDERSIKDNLQKTQQNLQDEKQKSEESLALLKQKEEDIKVYFYDISEAIFEFSRCLVL